MAEFTGRFDALVLRDERETIKLQVGGGWFELIHAAGELRGVPVRATYKDQAGTKVQTGAQINDRNQVGGGEPLEPPKTPAVISGKPSGLNLFDDGEGKLRFSVFIETAPEKELQVLGEQFEHLLVFVNATILKLNVTVEHDDQEIRSVEIAVKGRAP